MNVCTWRVTSRRRQHIRALALAIARYDDTSDEEEEGAKYQNSERYVRFDSVSNAVYLFRYCAGFGFEKRMPQYRLAEETDAKRDEVIFANWHRRAQQIKRSSAECGVERGVSGQ